nr:putative ribonuclease H-like domain-containing protein [Tanacetum cinerariifolium]
KSRFKPLSDDGKKVDEDPSKENECKDQKKEDNVNNTNNVNTVSLIVNPASTSELPFDPNMPALEDLSIFNFLRNDKDDDAMADMNNLDTTIQNLEEHGFVSTIQQRTNHKDLQNCLFACFLSQEKPKKVIHALKDPNWIEAMQKELLQFKLQEVWTLVDLLNGKRAIGSNWVFKNKKDERGIMIRKKARLVAQGYTQEEGIDYDEVFASVARIKAIRLFLAYASFKDFVVYQIDVKSVFLYEKIKEEVYVCQPPGFEDQDFPDRVYKVEKVLYGLHQAPRACKTASTPMETQKPMLKDEDGEEVDVHMIGSLMYLTSSRPDIMFVACVCARYQVNPKVSHLYAVKMIFRCQEAMGDTTTQTRFKSVSKHSNDSLLAREFLEKINNPPTQAQQRKIMCTYLKNMKGYTLKQLKSFEFDRIKEMFNKALKRVNIFKDFRTELVQGKEKRAGEEMMQERTKKQKMEDDKEIKELKQLMEIIPNEEVAIDAIPLAVKSLKIVDWKIYKEGKKNN